MQKPIVKFITLSYRHCSTCFGHHNAHHQEPVKLPSQPLVSVWMWRLRTLPPPHSYGNQRLRRQFDGLLMMGIVMPETCWAVSVRQSNKFYDWLLHLVGCFIWVPLIYVHITHKIAANKIFQQKCCKNCFFHFRTSFTGWKVMSGKRCQLYRGERSELNGAQYTLGRDYGSITSQYTLGPDYGMSQVRT